MLKRIRLNKKSIMAKVKTSHLKKLTRVTNVAISKSSSMHKSKKK